MADAPDPTDKQPEQRVSAPLGTPPAAPLGDRDLLQHFESLGGAGRGAEFGHFLARSGVEALGLLGWADLATNHLIKMLEQRFDDVGEPETTIIFRHNDSKEWWSRDTRYWMASRTLIKVESDNPNDAAPAILERLRSLRARLIADLTEGKKLFVFRDMVHDLDAARLDRLHAAIRGYGPSSLFYLRYEDAAHPAGLVEVVKPGLLIGYVANFTFSRDNQFIGPIDDVLLKLCRRAWVLHTGQLARAEPPPEAPPKPPAAMPPPARPPQRVRPSSRQIVFVGNSQAEAMVNLYRRFVSARTQDRVEYIPSYLDLGDEQRSALERSDLIVEQVMDLTPAAGTSTIAPGTPRIHLPLVTAAFLWPFRAQAHPKAVSYKFMPGGAFDAETSDSYLNRQIVAGTDPEQAVEEYINLDLGKVANLNRLYELMIDRQRARDAATGYDIATIIERHFKSEYIFLSPYHPNTRVALALADGLFRRMGATNDDIDRMRARTRTTPFPAGETPIHPGVCRHWGLDYIAPDQRYRFRNEGSFTFREYALRYMRYEWNPALEEGMWLSHQRRYAEAVAPLRIALAATPHSASGWHALGEALSGSGRNDSALEALRKAIDLDPSNARYHASLGSALRDAGRLPEAEAALRQAMAADRTEPYYPVLLAQVTRQQNNLGEAAKAFEAALALDPWAAQIWRDLAGVREAQTDHAGAQQALQRAAAIEAGDTGPVMETTDAQARHDRDDDARDPAPPPVQRQPEPAAPAPQPQASLQEAFKAAVIAPGSAEAYHRLGALLREAEDFVAAEQALRRALDLRPTHAHYHHELSVLYLQTDRRPDAIRSAEEAIAQEPTNLQRHIHLADVLGSALAFDQAREGLHAALTLAPDYLPFRIMISNLFVREGRLDEALTAARAIARDVPDDAQALRHLAHVEALLRRPAASPEPFQAD